MWRLWLLFDPRRALIVMAIFVFSMVMLLHFIVLSHPYWGGFLGWGTATTAALQPAIPLAFG